MCASIKEGREGVEGTRPMGLGGGGRRDPCDTKASQTVTILWKSST